MLSDATHIVAAAAIIAGAAGAAVAASTGTVLPARHRILAALRGEPFPAAASDAPHASATPQLRGVEAAAEPAIQVRDAA